MRTINFSNKMYYIKLTVLKTNALEKKQNTVIYLLEIRNFTRSL